MRFNRFIFLRYSLALFFFANLNWFIFMIPAKNISLVIPLLMIIGAIFPIKEFLILYDVNKTIELKNTKVYYIVQLILNLLLITSTFQSQIFSVMFPFLNINSYGILGMSSILGLGIVIGLFGLRKITALENDRDKGYKTYMDFKKSLKVSELNGK